SHNMPQLAGLYGPLDEYLNVLRSLVAADNPVPESFNQAEKTYHILKSRMLAMIVRGELPSIAGERTLDSLSSVRRLCDQWNKSLAWQPATELLNGTSHEEGSENRT
ncbi:MAG: Na/Pi cotransporter family protein, partial [Marinobacter sp.]|nr:Na/Pi cotransporter family protein [Marinobacter sp.]